MATPATFVVVLVALSVMIVLIDPKTRVDPCIFGGTPDCSQCGCAISSGLHWLKTVRVARMVKIETLVNGSVGPGIVLGKLRTEYDPHPRWSVQPASEDKLVQIGGRQG